MKRKEKKAQLRKKVEGSLKTVDFVKNSFDVTLNYFKLLHQNSYRKVGIYLSFKNEVSTSAIIKQLWDLDIEIYVPHLNSHIQKGFKKYTIQSHLIKNSMGFYEPEDEEYISINELDLMLVPLLAFDLSGYRLGRGGGFYDQLLEGDRPKAIGLAIDNQQVAQIYIESWDVKLDGVLTNSRFNRMRIL